MNPKGVGFRKLQRYSDAAGGHKQTVRNYEKYGASGFTGCGAY